MPSIPASSGRRRWTRVSTSVIARTPTASADSARPQPRSPIVSLATLGPRVNQAPAWMALRAPKASTITHSHVCLVKTDQPSRSSSTKEGLRRRGRLSGGARGGMCTRSRSAAETSQVAASIASAQPGPKATTRSRGDRRTDDREPGPLHRQQDVGGLEVLARHQGRHDAGQRGKADRGERAVEGGQHDQVPELGPVGEDQRGDGALAEAGADVGDAQQDRRGRTGRR